MAFALIIAGLVMIVAGVRDCQNTLVALVKSDFTGQPNFVSWIVALLVFGAIGYVEKLKPLSDAILLLAIVALFLTGGSKTLPQGGFFKQFSAAIAGAGSGSTPPVTQQ